MEKKGESWGKINDKSRKRHNGATAQLIIYVLPFQEQIPDWFNPIPGKTMKRYSFIFSFSPYIENIKFSGKKLNLIKFPGWEAGQKADWSC